MEAYLKIIIAILVVIVVCVLIYGILQLMNNETDKVIKGGYMSNEKLASYYLLLRDYISRLSDLNWSDKLIQYSDEKLDAEGIDPYDMHREVYHKYFQPILGRVHNIETFTEYDVENITGLVRLVWDLVIESKDLRRNIDGIVDRVGVSLTDEAKSIFMQMDAVTDIIKNEAIRMRDMNGDYIPASVFLINDKLPVVAGREFQDSYGVR